MRYKMATKACAIFFNKFRELSTSEVRVAYDGVMSKSLMERGTLSFVFALTLFGRPPSKKMVNFAF